MVSGNFDFSKNVIKYTFLIMSVPKIISMIYIARENTIFIYRLIWLVIFELVERLTIVERKESQVLCNNFVVCKECIKYCVYDNVKCEKI